MAIWKKTGFKVHAYPGLVNHSKGFGMQGLTGLSRFSGSYRKVLHLCPEMHPTMKMTKVTGLTKFRQNSDNKPWAYIGSKGLFAGLIFGGAYFRRGLLLEGILRFKLGLACQ